MSEQAELHFTCTNEGIINWVISRAEAARKPGTTLPTWMVHAFEDTSLERENGTAVMTSDVGSVGTNSIKQDRVFCFELVYIKVEDTVFTVIKDWLMVEGSTFQEMFELPVAGSIQEGTKSTNPIVLEQTSAASFRAFLNLLYGSRGTLPQGYDEWVGVLNLAVRWNFGEIRKRAIAGLNLILPSLGPAARIQLARRFSIGPWLRKGLIDLITEVFSLKLTREALMDGTTFALDTTTVANVFFACFKLSMDVSNGQPAIPTTTSSASGLPPTQQFPRSSIFEQPAVPKTNSYAFGQPPTQQFHSSSYFGKPISLQSPNLQAESSSSVDPKAQRMNSAKEAIVDHIFGVEWKLRRVFIKTSYSSLGK